MIIFDFLIFHNCNHCIKESIQFSPGWFCSLYSIHTSNKRCTTIYILRNIGVIFSEPFQIIGWWNRKKYFMNGDICIMECITDIKNPSSGSMHSCDRNIDSEGVSMFHRAVGLIKINNLNLKTPICTVPCNDLLCIRKVPFLNTWINE